MARDYMELPQRVRAAIEESRAVVRVGYPWWLRALLFRDVIAITLGRRIYLSGVMAGRGARELEALLQHELAHVRQVNRLGIALFLWRYLTEFFGHLRRVRSVGAAYSLISFEIEARAAEEANRESGL